MADEHQLHIGDHAQPTAGSTEWFATDDQLAKQLSQAQNGLKHIEAIVPSITRAIANVRGHLEHASTAEPTAE